MVDVSLDTSTIVLQSNLAISYKEISIKLMVNIKAVTVHYFKGISIILFISKFCLIHAAFF